MITTFTRMTRTRTAMMLILVLAALAIVVVTSGIISNHLAQAGGGSSAEFKKQKIFYISGDFEGLYPGANEQLELTVRNPHSFGIIVTEIDVVVMGTDTPGCPKTDVVGGSFDVNLEIDKLETIQTTVPVSMIANSDDDCQGARFSFTYGGEAVKK